MKRITKQLAALAITLCMVLCILPAARTEAAYISAKSVSLKAGMSKKLSIKGLASGKKVTWSSSNAKIASVSSSGKVLARKAGTTTITGKVGSKKYKCSVKVTSNIFYPKSSDYSNYSYSGSIKLVPTKFWYASNGKLAINLKVTNIDSRTWTFDLQNVRLTCTALLKNGQKKVISDSAMTNAIPVSLTPGGTTTGKAYVKAKAGIDLKTVKSIEFNYSF